MDPIRRVPTWVGGGGQRRARGLFKIFEEKGLGVNQAKLWASRAIGTAKMKGNSQQTRLFNTTELCNHPNTSQAFIGHQTTRTDRHCASEKQPAKADHSSVVCFECEIY